MSKYDYISVSRDEPVPVNKYDSIEWFMYIMLNKEKSLRVAAASNRVLSREERYR
jgi:hypothetical protein